ncbi:ferredoxin--NADP reductase [Nocardia arthritidis]|uniref:2Fe-2S iron-sulfur cluster binding domain-containing protein n=1 Tax=Nocardia arthritidis TaxID=228602 RepID=A0A6G9YFS6_9NOCA|nr:ferredoxin--NADP reductase [Nocardia arthritidis]QIS12034.1 2Fe-2S iron-sulfur cluster binding domain-containing protein [Nocardia arthritidis]
MNPRAHAVRIAEVIAETAEAKTFVFAVPSGLAEHFAYRPGQFLTLRVPSARTGSVARCYSLCSSPHLDPRPAVTVKRTAGGYASNLLCDTVSAGDTMTMLEPGGVFGPRDLAADVLLCAGGSGITPVFSIVKSMLAVGRGRIVLLYANRDRPSVIFARQLADLETRHPRRLRILHWLESERGLPTAPGLANVLRPYTALNWYACGPTGFLSVLDAAALRLRVRRVYREEFRSLDGNPFQEVVPATAALPTVPAGGFDAPVGAAATVDIEIDGATHTLDWPKHRRLLDVLLDSGIDAPYVCRESACGTCVCSVRRGRTRMVQHEALLDTEIAAGLTLACQTLPETQRVHIAFDQ